MRFIRHFKENFGGNQSYKWGIPLMLLIILGIIVTMVYGVIRLCA